MRIYPAIDIKDGNCVRLLRGSFDDVTVYGSSPAEMAKRWQDEGGEYIHVVDLDGALLGGGRNLSCIREICRAVDVPVQTGGGIRTMEDIQKRFDSGISRVIIGTKAVSDRDFVGRAVDRWGERIAVGIDAKDGMAAVEGWEKVSSIGAVELAQDMVSLGVRTIIYTDIATDGTLAGPNAGAMRKMASSVNADVIASGGIGGGEHIRLLEGTGVEGVIIGRALYTGAVSLAEAIEIGKAI